MRGGIRVVPGMAMVLAVTSTGCAGPPCQFDSALPKRAEGADSRPDRGETSFTVADVQVDVRNERPKKRYALETTKVYSREAAVDEVGAGDIADVSELSAATGELISRAIRDDGSRFDNIPPGLEDALDEYEFFTGVVDPEQTHTHFALKLVRMFPERSPELELRAEFIDRIITDRDPGVLAISVANRSERTQRMLSGPIAPFGVLQAEGRETDRRLLLWHEQYQTNDCVELEDGRVRTVCSIAMDTPLEPCERITRHYELRATTPEMEAGRYEVAGTLFYQPGKRSPESRMHWSVRFTLVHASSR